MKELEVIVLEPHVALNLVRAHEGDAGIDLVATTGGYIEPLRSELVGTGIKVNIPYGYVGLIHPRSGLAAKKNVTVLNAPGTVDAGYHGEVKVILYNASPDENFIYAAGDRIAQLIIQKVELPEIIPVDSFEEKTDRGEGGFGSTGV